MESEESSNSSLRRRKRSPASRRARVSSRTPSVDRSLSEDTQIEKDDAIVTMPETAIGRFRQLMYWALGDMVRILNEPHTFTILLCAVLLVIYAAFIRKPSEELYSNICLGIEVASFVFIVYGMLQFPDMITVRPHPGVWKAVHAIGLIYVIALTVILILPIDNARELMKIFDSSLGVELPERLYATDCRIYTPEKTNKFDNLYNCIVDEFFIAHFIGWIVKALMIRDWGLLWEQSLLFEVLEITFQYALPNFNECWWDKWIMDVLVCNFGGMAVGMWLVNKFAHSQYTWMDKPDVPKQASLFKKFLLRFTPLTWTVYKWDIFTSFKRWMQTNILVIIFEINELLAFALKYALWIPPRHSYNTRRMILWALLGFPAIREYYEFMDNKKVKKIGPNAWLCLIGIIIEFLIAAKFVYPEVKDALLATPRIIPICWCLFLLMAVCWALILIFGGEGVKISNTTDDTKNIKQQKHIYIMGKQVKFSWFFYLLPLPLVCIAFYDLYDKYYTAFPTING